MSQTEKERLTRIVELFIEKNVRRDLNHPEWKVYKIPAEANADLENSEGFTLPMEDLTFWIQKVGNKGLLTVLSGRASHAKMICVDKPLTSNILFV